jgi:hypothetical protein
MHTFPFETSRCAEIQASISFGGYFDLLVLIYVRAFQVSSEGDLIIVANLIMTTRQGYDGQGKGDERWKDGETHFS